MATMFADHPCVDDKNEMLFFQKVLFVCLFCLFVLFVNAKTSQRPKRATDKALRSVNSTH